MNPTLITYITLVALASGVWPLIVRGANLNAQWATITVTLATAVVASLVSFLSSPVIPSHRPIMIGLTAGAVNAIGMIAWGRLITAKSVELSKVLPIAFVLMPIVAALGAWLVFKEPMTAKKVAGITAAAVAIYLLQ